MDRKTLLVAVGSGALVFVIEEIRALVMLKEFERRFNDQSIYLASLTERLEMLEA